MTFRVVDAIREGSRWTFEVEVPENCRYFAGHFPSRPILPAIGHLGLICMLQTRIATTVVSLTSVDSLRLYLPVLAGDMLHVEMQAGLETEASRFRISRHGSLVSQGAVRWRQSAP